MKSDHEWSIVDRLLLPITCKCCQIQKKFTGRLVNSFCFDFFFNIFNYVSNDLTKIDVIYFFYSQISTGVWREFAREQRRSRATMELHARSTRVLETLFALIRRTKLSVKHNMARVPIVRILLAVSVLLRQPRVRCHATRGVNVQAMAHALALILAPWEIFATQRGQANLDSVTTVSV